MMDSCRLAPMVALFKPYHLLLADDDPGFRETLRLIFEPYFSLLEAESGEEAIELIERNHIDVALLDMHMRLTTGLDALRVLKSLNAAAPCILITADATEELRQSATEADAFSVLAKPVSRLDLVTTVSTAIEEAYEDRDFVSVLTA